MYSSIDIIFNPKSTGSSEQNAKDLKSKLLKKYRDIKVSLQPTKYAGHAEELAYELAKRGKNPLIISSSGDGGYNEVVNGAIKAQLEGATPICAVLASGNANDHSRTLQKKDLFELISREKPKHIDLLKMALMDGDKTEERYAHSYIGFGLTPVVATELNKTDLNAIKELWIVLRSFYKYRPFSVKHDGTVLKIDSMVFTNIGEMAKVVTLSKDSEATDGLFEVVTLRHSKKRKLLRIIAKAVVGSLEAKHQYSTYSLTVLKKMPAQLDGEIKEIPMNAEITITAERKLLRTIID